MRIFLIFFLLPIFAFCQVGFSTFGIVGNGTDETANLQTALDSGNNLINDVGGVFLISSTLHIDQSGDQDIDWNGATLTTTNTLNPMLDISKLAGGGKVTMNDLTVDGNDDALRGIKIRTPVNFTNVDVEFIKQLPTGSPSAMGMFIEITNDTDAFGNYDFDGCDIKEITGENNGDLINSQGAAYGMYISWKTVPINPVTINFRNAIVEKCLGEDASPFYFYNASGAYRIGTSSSHHYFTNVIVREWERRGVKGFSGGQTWTNCHLIDGNAADQTGTQLAAGIYAGAAYDNTNLTFEGCTFDGNAGAADRDPRIIFNNVSNVRINNCEFINGADLVFTTNVGDINICSTTFGVGSTTTALSVSVQTGPLRFDIDNIYLNGKDFTNMNGMTITETDLVCGTGNPNPAASDCKDCTFGLMN